MFTLVGPGGMHDLEATGAYEAVGEALHYLHHGEYVRVGQVFTMEHRAGGIIATLTVTLTGANVDFFAGK